MESKRRGAVWAVCCAALLAAACHSEPGGPLIECNPVGSYELRVIETEVRDGGGCGPVDGTEAVTVPFDLRLGDFANWSDCEGTLRVLESDTQASQCAIEWSFTCFYADGSEDRVGRATYVSPTRFEGEEIYSTTGDFGRCESRYDVILTRIGG